MALLRASWILFLAQLRRTVLSRRALLCALLALFPVGASLLVVVISTKAGSAPALEICWVLQIQLVVPLVALLLGTAAVAEEVDDRTITYLVTRPIPRAAVLVGRWLSALVVLSVLLGLSAIAVVALLDRAARGDPDNTISAELARRLVTTVLLGGVAYSAFFAALGAVVKRSVIVGLVYVFVVEGFLANLPGSNQRISLLYYLKSHLVADRPEILAEWQGEFVTVPLVDPADAVRTLLLVAFFALVLGGWRMSRKEYIVES